jgi:hypothetical protein
VLEHLCLREWPFQVVPDERTSQLWADRVTVLRDLKVLIRTYRRSQASSINLLWAYFGAGKTHFLRHLAYLATEQADGALLTFYSVFPKTVSSFVDLYRVLAKLWEPDAVAAAYVNLENSGELPALKLDHEFVAACRALVVRPDLSGVVVEWLRAGKPLLREMREAGVSQRLTSSERAIEVAVSALKLLLRGHDVNRVVWMIDEFQRIGFLRPSQRSDIHVGLHSIFNELPSGLSLLLSFSFGEARNIKYLLSEELLDRANMEKYFQLPLLQQAEAYSFVADLLAAHRPDGADCSPTFPFDESTVRWLLAAIDADRNLQLKPRTIMQVFNAVLSEADVVIEEGEAASISEPFAKQVFESRVQDALEAEDEAEEME